MTDIDPKAFMLSTFVEMARAGAVSPPVRYSVERFDMLLGHDDTIDGRTRVGSPFGPDDDNRKAH